MAAISQHNPNNKCLNSHIPTTACAFASAPHHSATSAHCFTAPALKAKAINGLRGCPCTNVNTHNCGKVLTILKCRQKMDMEATRRCFNIASGSTHPSTVPGMPTPPMLCLQQALYIFCWYGARDTMPGKKESWNASSSREPGSCN